MFDSVEDILANKEDNEFIEDALNLPLNQQYRALLAPRGFDYMDIAYPPPPPGSSRRDLDFGSLEA